MDVIVTRKQTATEMNEQKCPAVWGYDCSSVTVSEHSTPATIDEWWCGSSGKLHNFIAVAILLRQPSKKALPFVSHLCPSVARWDNCPQWLQTCISFQLAGYATPLKLMDIWERVGDSSVVGVVTPVLTISPQHYCFIRLESDGDMEFASHLIQFYWESNFGSADRMRASQQGQGIVVGRFARRMIAKASLRNSMDLEGGCLRPWAFHASFDKFSCVLASQFKVKPTIKPLVDPLQLIHGERVCEDNLPYTTHIYE